LPVKNEGNAFTTCLGETDELRRAMRQSAHEVSQCWPIKMRLSP
jgi:hypothetical protein